MTSEIMMHQVFTEAEIFSGRSRSTSTSSGVSSFINRHSNILLNRRGGDTDMLKCFKNQKGLDIFMSSNAFRFERVYFSGLWLNYVK